MRPLAEMPTEDGRNLRRLLEPSSVAVVGASDRLGSVGELTVRQLLSSRFSGEVFPVNPNRERVAGRRCYPSLEAVPVRPDLVVLAVANNKLESELRQAARKGAGAAVVFASAYGETEGGLPLTEGLAETARDAGIALCGANCMGFANFSVSLTVCGYTVPDAGPGPVALISHSGSSFSALLHNDRSLRFSVAVSSGQELVTTAADYLAYAVMLPETRVVGLILEEVRQVDRFADAMALAHARSVPVVCLKVGRSRRAADAIRAHSGALAGDDGAYEAFFRRHGVHRVLTLDELADSLELFSRSRATAPGGVAAVTDSGGERALLIDSAGDLPLAAISPATASRLSEVLDPGLEPTNPVDAWGTGAEAERVFIESLCALEADGDAAVVLFAVDLTGLSSNRYVEVSRTVAASVEKPFAVLTNFRSGANRDALARLRDAGIPVLEGTATGLAAVRHLLAERDHVPGESRPRQPRAGREKWRARLASGAPLGEAEALSLVAEWGIPTVAHHSAGSLPELREAAGRVGYPLVLKTAEVLHKSDVGGVVLGLATEEELSNSYRALADRLGPRVTVQPMVTSGVEIALGIVDDPSFGPIVVVGSGGVLAELIADRQVALPPVTVEEALALLSRLRIARLFEGFRGGEPVDVASVAHAIAALSELALDLAGSLSALDINPLLAGPSGCVAVDARATGGSDGLIRAGRAETSR